MSRRRRRLREEDYGHYGPQRPRAGLGFHGGDDDGGGDDDRDLAHVPPALQLPPLLPAPPPGPPPPAAAAAAAAAAVGVPVPVPRRGREGPRLVDGVLPGFVRARAPATVTGESAEARGGAKEGEEGECPGVLYAELLQRAPEAEEMVVVVGDGEVEVIEEPAVRRAGPDEAERTRNRRERRRKRRRERQGGGGGGGGGAAAAGRGRQDADGVIVLDSDEEEEGEGPGQRQRQRQGKVAAAAQAAEVVSVSSSSSSSSSDNDGDGVGFFCELCGERVASMPRRAHERTTLHVFNARRDEPLAGSYNRITLPASNRGVRILARMGWDAAAGKGLGREGQGRVEPAKSTLKLDRRGLGHAGQPKARVTHFPAHSEEEARRAGDGRSAAQRAVEEAERRRRRGGASSSGKGGGGASSSSFETAAQRTRRLREEKARREKIMRELNEDHAVDVRLRGPQAAERLDFSAAVAAPAGRRGQGQETRQGGGVGREGEGEDEEAPAFGRVERPRTFWPT